MEERRRRGEDPNNLAGTQVWIQYQLGVIRFPCWVPTGRARTGGEVISRSEPIRSSTHPNADWRIFSAMVLPMGAYKPSSDPTKTSSKLDGRVLGMPSSTMSSVTLSGTAQGNIGRRLSLTGLSRPASTTPAHLLGDMPPPVTYSAHQAPPSKISSSQVLVQVYAVALDRFDFDMVREKTEHGNGAGKWVPGRSFVGRALQVGAEVRSITKGDMVMGLVDIKKVSPTTR